ncbi:MAG TPA: FkbM family methyltransferase [Methanocorpusculum sp.]|nr:FkbM family methyltransferase [Methanocorpusculum sp.]
MNRISLYDRIHYTLTKNRRTEDFYRGVYEKIRARYFDRRSDTLKIGPLTLPMLSHSAKPTREEAYYAMEIVDILYPGLFSRYHFSDEGPYEWGDVKIRPGAVVFDCGANLGIFSLFAAYRGAEVYAFEPIADARRILHETISLNPQFGKKIHVEPFAIGKDAGFAEFTVLEDTLVGSSMVLEQRGRKERAQVTTIDAFCAKRALKCDFIKADIEGAERQMLAGAARTLKHDAPMLSVCTYHLKDDPVVLKNLVLEANPEYQFVERWKKFYAVCAGAKH